MENTYALIICVENYTSSHIRKVAFAEKDGRDLKDVLVTLGVEEENIKILANTEATSTAILAELELLNRRVTKNDRVIFFFSGHGTYIGGENYIMPVDAYPTHLKGTCVAISSILGFLKKNSSNKKIIFLDCCHSGFEPGENIKDADDSFLADELIYHYKDEEYCCGFASSKSHEKSISDKKLQNGVWTHYLLNALSGKAKGIYVKGLLFSDKLQSYLNKNVREYVKLNTIDKKDQTPIMFGNISDKFIVADLNTFFENKEKENEKSLRTTSFTDISLTGEEDGDVKTLPEFKKSIHKVPDSIYFGANQFIRKIGSPLIKSEIDDLANQIKSSFKYKRSEIQVDYDEGEGAIITPHFTFTIELKQSETEASEYIILRRLESFANNEVALEENFNKIFENTFNTLEIRLTKKFDLLELIDLIEELDDDKIQVDYDSIDITSCTISIEGFDKEIVISEKSLLVVSKYFIAPVKLISSFKIAQELLFSNQSIKELLLTS